MTETKHDPTPTEMTLLFALGLGAKFALPIILLIGGGLGISMAEDKTPFIVMASLGAFFIPAILIGD
jgi:hypothetical protein